MEVDIFYQEENRRWWRRSIRPDRVLRESVISHELAGPKGTDLVSKGTDLAPRRTSKRLLPSSSLAPQASF